jgi:hypothetical protein
LEHDIDYKVTTNIMRRDVTKELEDRNIGIKTQFYGFGLTN